MTTATAVQSKLNVYDENVPARVRQRLGRYPIPVVVLTRMAVDKRYQGRGLGRALLRDALLAIVEFSERVAFVDVSDEARTVTGDRREFLGRNGSLARPAGLGRARLSGRVGSGLDPCAAVQVMVDLPDSQERQVSFRLGVGRSPADAQDPFLRKLR